MTRTKHTLPWYAFGGAKIQRYATAATAYASILYGKGSVYMLIYIMYI